MLLMSIFFFSTCFEDCLCFFPPEMFSGRSGSWTGGKGVWVELSGKMHVLARFLSQLHRRTDDRIVLVSNYTQACCKSLERWTKKASNRSDLLQVYQRQMSKEGLQKVIQQEQIDKAKDQVVVSLHILITDSYSSVSSFCDPQKTGKLLHVIPLKSSWLWFEILQVFF
ncbi:hypothetical protein HYC85_029239 [Camellia sinensis]|uniref:SNF2 N-terminal domain-containing protein n=1 Tax=Camellia sinensis TaxID=4442 RepID=A0A7J7FZU6_CAMSI|nr:hypothetical protein HYC85_029239 [Camellia sinensis]